MGEVNIIEVAYGTRELIAAEISGLGEGSAVLVAVKPPIYWESLRSFMDVLLSDKKLGVVYVAANKPAQKVAADLEDAKISAAGIAFIDCVSKQQAPKSELCLPVASELLEAITKSLAKQKGRKALVIDSLSALALYNSENEVERFVHELASRLFEWKARGFMFVSLSAKNPGFVDTISAVFDKVIRIRG